MYDYTLVSSDDMVNWTDHGEVFNVRENTDWAWLAYAPAAIARNGKVYLYFPNGASNIGVAVADRPQGPFTDPLGGPLVSSSTPGVSNKVAWIFDPAVFIDDDGQAYLYFGGGGEYNGENLAGIRLNEDMISVSGSAVTIPARNSFEAAFVHKHDGKYYFSYSTDFSEGSARIDYLMSDNPLTGYDYKGVVLDNPSLDGRNINTYNNNHASIIEFQDNWYIFYHDRRLSGETYFRNVSVDLLSYSSDGTMNQTTVTSEGPEQIKYLNPLDTIQAETINLQSGVKTAACSDGGVMVTDINDGDYIRVKGVDFGEGVSSCEMRAASETGGGTVELRLGSPSGTLVGTCEISATGGWDKWETFECDITGCSGIEDLYLVFRGAGEPYRLNWYRFFESAGYALSVDVQGMGSVASSSELQRFEEGTEVTLTATPSEGWVFDGWVGDVTGNQNPLTITMNRRKTITAVFLTEYGTENLVRNGTFCSGDQFWTFNNWGGEGSGSVVDEQYQLAVDSAGEEHYDIQVVQPGIPLENGKTYRVVFDAYASAQRELNVNVGMPEEPWTSFLSTVTDGASEVELTTSKQTFRFDFIMQEPTYEDSRIEFNVGLNTPNVYLDNVSLYETASSDVSVPERKTAASKIRIRQKGSQVGITLNHSMKENALIKIYDLKGSVVHTATVKAHDGNTQRYRFDSAGMPKGFYVVTVIVGPIRMNSGMLLLAK